MTNDAGREPAAEGIAMVVVDVLLGLNLLVLLACALRGQANRHGTMLPARTEPGSTSVPTYAPQLDAVILPFGSPRRDVAMSRAMALHPSAQGWVPQNQ